MKLASRLLLAAFGIAFAIGSAAQSFPSKPLRLIVPYPAGGTIDALARALQNDLSKAFGQPVVVENKGGAGGRIGVGDAAKSPADGHTAVLVFDSVSVDPILYKDMPYDIFKDLVPVSLVARVPMVAMASLGTPVDDMKDLVAYARSNPGKLSYGSVGIGSSSHLIAELFAQKTGATMLHVPYKGGANIQVDLYGNSLNVYWGTSAFAKAALPSGKIKILGQAGKTRSPFLPNARTLSEQGFDSSVEVYGWTGVMLPGGTPPDIVARWQSELVKVGRSPAVATKIADQGWELVLGTSDEFRNHIRAEHDKWAQIIKAAKIPMQN